MLRREPYKLCLLLAAVTITFLVFAKYGMHIADDGIILASAKRIVVDLQIPHRDFISLRPVGTFFLWAPIVLSDSDFIILASRFLVMFQFGLIAYFWISLFEYFYNTALSRTNWALLFLAVFFFNFNIFWLFPLYTTDGVFFCSLGAWLIFRAPSTIQNLGFLTLGIAGLAKQNFFGFIPIVILCSGNIKNYRSYIFSMVPALAYLFWLHQADALNDFLIQLRQYPFHSTFFRAGVTPLIKSKYFFIGLFLGILFQINFKKYKNLAISITFTFTVFLFFRRLLLPGYHRFLMYIFGLNLSLLIFSLKNKDYEFSKYLGLSCSLGWISSFSLVFQNPHSAGYLVPPVLYIFSKHLQLRNNFKRIVSLLSLASIIFCFSYHRYFFTFENSTSMRTPHEIDHEFPGAKGMIVGDLMFKILNSAHELYLKYSKESRKVALIPAFTNFWLKKEYKNPLPVLWLVGTDIVGEGLVQKVIDAIDRMESGDIFIVDDFDGLSLHRQHGHKQKLLKPVRERDKVVERVIKHIISKSKIIEQNEYFVVYEKI